MIEIVKIAHPLREITLEYDRSKPETECEKELIAMHLRKHDYVFEIVKEQQRIAYNKLELVDILEVEMKRFTKTEADIDALFNEVKFYFSATGNEDLMHETIEKIQAIGVRINEEHINIIAPIQVQFSDLGTIINAVHEKLEAGDGVDFYEYSAKNIEVSQNWETVSLDIIKIDDEMEAIKEKWRNAYKELEKKDDLFIRYASYNERLSITYEKLAESTNMLIDYLDKDRLFDCSISESFANGTGDESKRPIYFLQPGERKVKLLKQSLGMGIVNGIKVLRFDTTVENVRNTEPGGISELLIVLQHYPKLLEYLIFSCRVDIKTEYGAILDDLQWKGDPIAMEWYSKLRNFPASLFFFEDNEARAYILMGDIKFEDKEIAEKGDGVALSGDKLEEVCNRLYNICYFFFVFCHNTGFDPSNHIDDLLTHIGLPVTMEFVKKGFEEDLKKGIKLSIDSQETVNEEND